MVMPTLPGPRLVVGQSGFAFAAPDGFLDAAFGGDHARNSAAGVLADALDK